MSIQSTMKLSRYFSHSQILHKVNTQSILASLVSTICRNSCSSSYSFVGSQSDNLFYLDPHNPRPAIPLQPRPFLIQDLYRATCLLLRKHLNTLACPRSPRHHHRRIKLAMFHLILHNSPHPRMRPYVHHHCSNNSQRRVPTLQPLIQLPART